MIYLEKIGDKNKMNNNGLIGQIVLILLVVIGGYFLLKYFGLL